MCQMYILLVHIYSWTLAFIADWLRVNCVFGWGGGYRDGAFKIFVYSGHHVKRMAFRPQYFIRMRQTFFSTRQKWPKSELLNQRSRLLWSRFSFHTEFSSRDVHCTVVLVLSNSEHFMSKKSVKGRVPPKTGSFQSVLSSLYEEKSFVKKMMMFQKRCRSREVLLYFIMYIVSDEMGWDCFRGEGFILVSGPPIV